MRATLVGAVLCKARAQQLPESEYLGFLFSDQGGHTQKLNYKPTAEQRL
jgi:hypothetical protein